MIDVITAAEAHKNAKMCQNVVAENPLFNASVRNVSILFNLNRNEIAEDIILQNIEDEICNRSYCGGLWAKIRIKLPTDRDVNFPEISSRLHENGFNVIYGGNDKEVNMFVEW